MKHALMLLLVLSALAGWERSQAQSPSRIAVYFSPHGGCTDAIVAQICSAKREVLVQAYEFTSTPIAAALVAAKKRGVDVQVILDKEKSGDTSAALKVLRNSPVPLFADGKYAIAHNKVMVIDRRTVITGSFNFTAQAETANAENLLVIDDANVAAQFAENWQMHKAGSARCGKAAAASRNELLNGFFAIARIFDLTN